MRSAWTSAWSAGVTMPFVPRSATVGLVVPAPAPPVARRGLARPEATALLVVGAQRAIASQCAGASYVWETISALVAALRPGGP